MRCLERKSRKANYGFCGKTRGFAGRVHNPNHPDAPKALADNRGGLPLCVKIDRF